MACLLWALVGSSRAEVPLGSIAAERAFPPEAMFAVFIPDGDAAFARYKNTFLYDLYSDPEVQLTFAPTIKLVKDIFREIDKGITGGLPSNIETTDLLKGEFGLAVESPGLGTAFSPMLYVIVRPKDPMQFIKIFEPQIREVAMAKMKGKGPQVAATISLDQIPPQMLRDMAPQLETMPPYKIPLPPNPDYPYFEEMVASIRQSTLLITLGKSGSINKHTEAMNRLDKKTGGFADKAVYSQARKQLGDAAGEMWLYMDPRPFLKEYFFATAMQKAGRGADLGQKMMDGMGFGKMDAAVIAFACHDKGIQTGVYLHAPEPREGILAMLGGKTCPNEALMVVPKSASSFKAGYVNWPALHDGIRTFATKLPQLEGGVVMGLLGTPDSYLKVKLKEDLFAYLGDYYVYYRRQEAPGGISAIPTLCLAVKDRTTFDKNLKQGLDGLCERINAQAPPDRQPVAKVLKIIRKRDTQYCFDGPMSSLWPNFIVTTSQLYTGFSARTVLDAASNDGKRKAGDNVTNNSDFKRVARFVPKTYTSISYVDVSQFIAEDLQVLQLLLNAQEYSRYEEAKSGGPGLAQGVAAKLKKTGAQIKWEDMQLVNPGRFPDEAALKEKCFGSVATWTADKDGVCWHNFSPIGPVPAGMITFNLSNPSLPVMTALAIPSIVKARKEAQKTSDLNNLNQIGLALKIYISKNGGKYPFRLEDLSPDCAKNDAVFKSPADATPTRGQKNIMLSYDFVGNVPISPPRDCIIAYTRKGVFEDGRHVLRASGKVEWLAEAEIAAELQSSYLALKEAWKEEIQPRRKLQLCEFYGIKVKKVEAPAPAAP